MGRPRKPVGLAVVAGDYKVHPERRPGPEPVPSDPGQIVPPWPLSEGAQYLWDLLSADLIRKGVLTQWDTPMFWSFCESMEALHNALGSGGIYKTPQADDGVPVGRVRDLVGICTQLGSRFGLSPTDRAKLTLRESEPNAKDRLLS